MRHKHNRGDNDTLQLEARLLSAFHDTAGDDDVLLRTRGRLREVMAAPTTAPRAKPLARLGPIAASVALIVVAGFIGWRLIQQRVLAQHLMRPSPTPKSQPPVAAVDSFNCKLPLLVTLQAGPPGQQRQEVGFVDTRTGRYVADESASAAGLPGGGATASGKPAQPATPVSYSASLRRWLPVLPISVSPDGRSYVWVRLLPEGPAYGPNNFEKAELHKYDVASATDRTLWTYAGDISVFGWDASGILLETTPPIIHMVPQRGISLWWLVDPQTGAAAQQVILGRFPAVLHLPGDPMENGTFVYSEIGAEFQGHPLFRIGSRDPGAPEWVFYETSPGIRITIYRGTQGDARHFDPDRAYSDQTGIWFGDFGGNVLWRWEPQSGLRKLPLTGLPSRIVGAQSSNLFANPVGVCS